MPTPTDPLTDLARGLDEARASGRPDQLAPALIDWAEAAPLFRYCAAPVEAALIEASRLLPALAPPVPALEGRCLLRLAEVKMLEGLLDQAAQLADQAEPRLRQGGGDEAALRATCLRTRILRRRGEAEAADRLLAEASAGAIALDRRRAPSAPFIALTLAIADGQVEELKDEGIDTLRALLNLLDRYHIEAKDARFAAHQGIALLAETSGRLELALIHLRAAVALVKPFDAPLDLIECRLALGTALLAARQHAEARRVLQAVVDASRDLGAEQHRLLGLTALSTVLAGQGAVRGAVDLAIQTAVGYAKQGNLLGYVRGATLAAHALIQGGRAVQAIELLMYGVAALRRNAGEQAAQLMQLQLDAIAAELGEAEYERLCQELLELRAARKRLDSP
jgi:ATP/maltotriose-dependent transcriptional regulator MalT